MWGWAALQHQCSASHRHTRTLSQLNGRKGAEFLLHSPSLTVFCMWAILCLLNYSECACEPRFLWVTLQPFATVMLQNGEWVTHPFSRHILTHSPGRLRRSISESWLSGAVTWEKNKKKKRSDVRKAQDLCCIRIQATKPALLRLAAGGEEGVSMTQLQHHDTSLSLSLSLAVRLPHCSLRMGGS